jgi:putative phosphoribosyl transferase
MFADRTEAGEALGALLAERGERADVVLGIPRGGVVVAAPVAAALDCSLDVALARKIGAPGNPELAVGAVGPDGSAVVDELTARHARVSADWIEQAAAAQAGEIARRVEQFRPGLPPLDVTAKRVVVVDDGVATGSTAAAVGRWLRADGAASAVLAVPVAPASAPDRLVPPYDRLVAVSLPERLFSVGEHYRRFDQTSDDEVVALLARYRRGRGG